MSLILTGTLAADLLRAKTTTEERFDEGECQCIFQDAYPASRVLENARASLEHGACHRALARARLASIDGSDLADPYALEVVIGRHKHVQRTLKVVPRYLSFPLASDSLLHVNPDLGMGADTYVTNPALTWLLASARMSGAEALAFATELCGTYSTRPHGLTLYHCPPATTPDYLQIRARAIREAALGRRIGGWEETEFAAPFIFGNSASPMETKAAIMLSLPVSRGGWGIEGLALNRRIELSRDQRRIANKSYLVIDGYLAREQLGYEYDSDEFHEGVAREERDRLRATAAQCLGLTLLSLTKNVIESEIRFTAFCDEFARLAGKRPRALGPRTLARRRALRRNLGLSVQDASHDTYDSVPLEAYEDTYSTL